jgi:GT2 family glycosyltransferase
MDLSVVIVNWNVRELLGRCLASLEANRGNLSLKVIVVDNASSRMLHPPNRFRRQRIRISRSRILYFRRYFGAGRANVIRLFFF